MKKRLTIFALILALLFAGCAATSDSTMQNVTTEDSYVAMSESTSAIEPSMSDMTDTSLGQQSNSTSVVMEENLAEKMVYTASANVETMEFEQALSDVSEMVSRTGGFLESSSVSGVDYASSMSDRVRSRSAEFVIRIPAGQFGNLRQELEEIGNVTHYSENAENISFSYYDADARLSASRIEEERLLEMLEQASTVEDMITIEQRLSDVRYSIESLTTSLNLMDMQVDYSTLTLSLQEVIALSEEVPQSYGGQMLFALRNTTQAMRDFLADGLIVLVCAVVVCAIPAVVIIFVVLRVRRHRKKKNPTQENPECEGDQKGF